MQSASHFVVSIGITEIDTLLHPKFNRLVIRFYDRNWPEVIRALGGSDNIHYRFGMCVPTDELERAKRRSTLNIVFMRFASV